MLNDVADVGAEFFMPTQLLDGQMHTPTPIMTWVRRDVDTLTIGIWIPHAFVYRQPVLE